MRPLCHIAISVRKFHTRSYTRLHRSSDHGEVNYSNHFSLLCRVVFLHREIFCSGNFANLAYTFGGRYNGSGDRRAASSYTNSVVAGASNDPRRVNAVMYSHVASRPNNCLAVPSTATTNCPTNRTPTQKPTTAKPIARSPTQKPTTRVVKPPTRKPTQKPTPKPTQQPTPFPTFYTPLPTDFPTYDFFG